MLLVMADLCNQFFDRGTFHFKPEAANRERYLSLFMQSKGRIYAVNHIPRQQTDVFATANGTAFTNAVIQAIHELINPQAKWETVMARARFFTVKSSNGNQNPLSDIQVTQDLKGGDYNFHQEDRMTSRDVKFNPQVNQDGKRGSSASTASVTNRDTGTEAPAYEGGGKFSDISPENPESMKRGTLQRIEQLQNSLSSLVSASSEEMLEKILSMFADQNRMVEVSHLSRGKSRAKPKRYLGRLIDSGKGHNLEISWYKPTEIEDLKSDGDGNFKTYAVIYQQFKRTSKRGELLYGDRTSKKVEVFVKKIGENWKVMLGDITVLETLPIEGE
jgi:hypothetical protein